VRYHGGYESANESISVAELTGYTPGHMDHPNENLQAGVAARLTSRRRLWGMYTLRAMGWIFIAIVIWAATITGLKARYWTYQVFD
jgi:hypothetical protein